MFRRIALSMMSVAVFTGCSAAPAPEAAENSGVTEASQQLNGDEAVRRAETWVQAGLLYCQAPYQRWDGACGYTCNRQSNSDWNAYRSDCSGLVSYAWGLPAPGRVTTGFAPFNTQVSRVIDAASLSPGDALNTSEHIILFKGWVTPGSRATLIEEYDCNKPAREIASNVRVSGNSLIIEGRGTFTAIRYTGANSGGADPGASCAVASDSKLYCSNTAGATMYASTSLSSEVVNHLRSGYSWFGCWGTGDLHEGGNRTWYYTLGDDNGNWGWVPAVNLNTTSSFDSNPSAQGLKQCASSAPTSGCSVAGDGKLYCTNAAGASMYSSPVLSSTVVNHLRSTFSWFDCWGTGDRHAGGNTTWYHTLGDDNSNWGWVPAVNLSTTSSFDGDPGAQGLARCGS